MQCKYTLYINDQIQSCGILQYTNGLLSYFRFSSLSSCIPCLSSSCSLFRRYPLAAARRLFLVINAPAIEYDIDYRGRCDLYKSAPKQSYNSSYYHLLKKRFLAVASQYQKFLHGIARQELSKTLVRQVSYIIQTNLDMIISRQTLGISKVVCMLCQCWSCVFLFSLYPQSLSSDYLGT